MASIHLLFMEKREPYLEKGSELKRWLSEYVQNNYEERATLDYLADKTGVGENTLRNYFYGKSQITLKVLLYFVFAFKMDSTDAYAFLNLFGYSKYSLHYTPYHDFIDLIGDYFYVRKYTPKEYVDKIIRESSESTKLSKSTK